MKKAAYYVRVSSEFQEKEQAVESQIAELEEIIRKDGNKLVKRYCDNGFSGGTTKRPALTELREDLSKGLFEILYVTDFDRLNRNFLNQLLIIDDFKKHNVKLRCKGKFLTEANELFVKSESMFAEYRKKRTAEDSKRGKLYWAKKGKLMNVKPPYGYDYISKKNEGSKTGLFVINPKEVSVVKLIAELYLKYQSPLRVARELIQRNIPTKQGGKWTSERIRSLLRNEAYIGRIYYNKYHRVEPMQKRIKFTRRENTSKKLRDKKDWVAQEIPAILNKNSFNIIQQLLKKNYKPFGKSKRFYLLSGILRCAKCGSKMNGEVKRVKGRKEGDRYFYTYYRCHNKELRAPLPKSCYAKPVRVEEVDNTVWNAISKATQDLDYLQKLMCYYHNQDRDKQLLIGGQKSLFEKKAQMKRKKDKLFELYEFNKIDKKILMKGIGAHTQEEKETDNLLKEIEKRLEQMVSKDIMFKNLQKFYQLTKNQPVRILASRQKKELLNIIIKKLTYNSDTREITLISYVSIPGILKEWSPHFESSKLVLPLAKQFSLGLTSPL